MRRAESGGRGFALLLLFTGAAGLLASWVITLDKFKLLQDPDFTPGCSLNPVVSCGSVMESDQAEAFGFPNPMLGLVAYAIVICVGMSLLAGAAFPRWYWLTLDAGCLFSIDSDAHAPGQLDFLQYGAERAEKNGVPADRIVTTWPVERLLEWAAPQ